MKKIAVSFNEKYDSRAYPAELIDQRPDADLALLKIARAAGNGGGEFPYVKLGRSDDLMIGERVIAIGNPYGKANTVSSGILSATGRSIQVQDPFTGQPFADNRIPASRIDATGSAIAALYPLPNRAGDSNFVSSPIAPHDTFQLTVKTDHRVASDSPFFVRYTLARDFRNVDPRRTRVLLLEAGPRILPSFQEKQSRRATRDLEAMGVQVRVGARVPRVVVG